MAIVNGYCTQQELTSYIGSANNLATIPTTHRAEEMDIAITTASRMIDRFCNRAFYSVDPAARVFAGVATNVIDINDCHTITAVETDTSGDGTFDTAWASSDYQTEPLNGVVGGIAGWPTTRLRAIGNYRFQVSTEARVRVTATWGWAAVPDEIKTACLIQSHRILSRAESPHDIVGFGDGPGVRFSPVDRDVQTILVPFRRWSDSIWTA